MAPVAEATYQSLIPGSLELAASGRPQPGGWRNSICALPGQLQGRRPGFRSMTAGLRVTGGEACATARPEAVLFGAISDPRLRVIRPIPLKVAREGEQTRVQWVDTDTVASGGTLTGAMEKFGARLCALFHELVDSRSLDEDRARLLEVLAEHIAFRPA